MHIDSTKYTSHTKIKRFELVHTRCNYYFDCFSSFQIFNHIFSSPSYFSSQEVCRNVFNYEVLNPQMFWNAPRSIESYWLHKSWTLVYVSDPFLFALSNIVRNFSDEIIQGIPLLYSWVFQLDWILRDEASRIRIAFRWWWWIPKAESRWVWRYDKCVAWWM